MKINDRKSKYCNFNKPWRLNLRLQKLKSNWNAESLISKKIDLAQYLLRLRINNEIKNAEAPVNQFKGGALYCPRCGLRIPISQILGYYGGHCPYCGHRMVAEPSLPYTSNKSKNKIKTSALENYFFDTFTSDNQL